MLKVDLSESAEDRLHQAMDALAAAYYDPITTTASWHCDHRKLSPMAYDRLREIALAAIAAVPGGSDEAAALEFLRAVSVNRPAATN